MIAARLVYVLCALTSLGCGGLLLRACAQRGARLQLWSGVGFGFLVLNDILLIVDLVLIPSTDLSIWRAASGRAVLVSPRVGRGMITETPTLTFFLWGASSAAAAVAGLFFLASGGGPEIGSSWPSRPRSGP